MMTMQLKMINSISLLGDLFLGRPPVIPDFNNIKEPKSSKKRKSDMISRLGLRVAYATPSTAYISLRNRVPVSYWQFPDTSISERIMDDISNWLFRR